MNRQKQLQVHWSHNDLLRHILETVQNVVQWCVTVQGGRAPARGR